jgi:AraC-like DNA-binding protein
VELLLNLTPKAAGTPLPIPAALNKYVAPWAAAQYRKYFFGHLLIQRFATKKISICIWRIIVEQPVTLYPYADKPIVALQFTTLGNISTALKGFGNKVLEESKYGMFYVPQGTHEATFEPGEYESFHIEIEPSYLEDIAGNYAVIVDLLQKLYSASVNGTALAEGRIDHIVKNTLNNLRHCTEKNGALNLELEKYILDLLCRYVTELKRNGGEAVLPAIQRKDTLLEIRALIMQHPNIHSHTLGSLAQQHHMSITTLKRNFKALFGTTLAAFVQLQCMEKAKQLLQTSKGSIEDIADELGYARVSNFSRAFKKHFKQLPHEYRKIHKR